ncbi:LysR family transcriptional regulator [Methylomonas koyamae]|uniref:LysR family transcriptional regulator n=1 Tax=Methylomonas koyamae TaxID=702114 RepID=A0A291IHP4_9GAMM|nr:LysR family transcriptional regulator [Methylomonas koyamae]ATG89711.1 LysR family transcriptional regulator [Methylomonas koyamae]OAI29033.1 LysR family transcriptional regulator [Methylomonas koyamae]
MQDLNDLYYYVQTVDHGGFAPAGRALGMPKSKLSRRIAQLEERLGVRLIQRSTRHFSVTEVGQTYYDHCKAMLVEAEAAQAAIDTVHAEPCGVIRLTCPVALLHAHIGFMLADFMMRYPQVTVYLEATNRRVDLLSEGVDVAIRVRPPPLEDSDLVMRVLSDRGQCLVASPKLVQQFGLPTVPADLNIWPTLGLGSPQQSHSWQLFGENGAEAVLHHRPRFVTTDMIALRNAAVAGVGIVQLPVLMVQEQLIVGSLIRLLPEWQPRREIIHAVFPSRRGLLPSVRALIDYLADRYWSFEED